MKGSSLSIRKDISLVTLGGLIIIFFILEPAFAQVASSSSQTASSTPSVADTASTSPSDNNAASSTGDGTTGSAPSISSPIADAISTTSEQIPTPGPTGVTTATTTVPLELSPDGLTLADIITTTYTDYFTDGTSTIAYPGDPTIDSNLNQPNAPIPTHDGLTWVHTTSQYLYDTPSGELDVGDYAVDPVTGNYIENLPPSTFVSSTSTPDISTSRSDTSNSTTSTSQETISPATSTEGATSTP